MNIKSSQTLVEEAQKKIETLSPNEVKNLAEKKEITLIDVRDIRELWKEGTIANSKHIVYAKSICSCIDDSAKMRGTGIARRTPEYIIKKIESFFS